MILILHGIAKKREHDKSFLNSYKYFANSRFGNLFIIDLFEGYKDINSPALDKLCLEPNKVK